MDTKKPMLSAKIEQTPPSSSKNGSEKQKLALQVLVALSEALPRQNGSLPLTPAALELMATAIAAAPVTCEQIAHAGNRAVVECDFFPTPKKLLELAGIAPPADAARAAELAGWETAKSWVRRYEARLTLPETGELGWIDQQPGTWRKNPPAPIVMPPPAVEHAMRHIGGPEVVRRAMRSGEEQWARRDFCEAYRLAPEMDRQGQRNLDAGITLPALPEWPQ